MTKLTQKQLESHLWESANILCGSIDSSDYKIYIFGMLFLKRLSDVFEDEVKAVIEREMADGLSHAEAEAIAEDPDEHQFYVPERARWKSLSQKTFNIGEEIQKAFYVQVKIMRAFPVLTWQDIQKRYAYHFGEGSFAPHYAGRRSIRRISPMRKRMKPGQRKSPKNQ